MTKKVSFLVGLGKNYNKWCPLGSEVRRGKGLNHILVLLAYQAKVKTPLVVPGYTWRAVFGISIALNWNMIQN